VSYTPNSVVDGSSSEGNLYETCTTCSCTCPAKSLIAQLSFRLSMVICEYDASVAALRAVSMNVEAAAPMVNRRSGEIYGVVPGEVEVPALGDLQSPC
jgi:hypothetical protein